MTKEDKIVSIYTLTDPRNGEVKYVGKTEMTLQKRLNLHTCIGKSIDKRTYKMNWIISLLSLGLKPNIEEVEVCQYSDWEECEKFWISMFKFWGFKLTNLNSGGLVNNGQKRTQKQKQERVAKRRSLSKETKRKISESNKGVKKSEKHKKAMSDSAKTKPPMSSITKKKISFFQKGKPKTLKHREKMGIHSRKKLERVDSMGFITMFNSLKEASEILNIGKSTISRALKLGKEARSGIIWREIK